MAFRARICHGPPVASDAATSTPILTTSGKRVLLGMLGVLLIAVAVLIVTYVERERDPELPDLGTVPAFSLVDDSGSAFTDEALRGHPTIINFIFTRCDTICPVIAMKTQRLQDKTADRKGIGIKLLSISVDPEHDTPAKLAEFAARYQADPTRWRFLTGPADKVRELVTGPLMNVMDRDGNMPSGAPQIVHSGYFLLVDDELVIRGVYDSNDMHKLDELMRHARFLARTAGSGRQYKFGGS
jgi:protein SCO1/2